MAKVFLFCLAWLFSFASGFSHCYGSIYSLELREGPIGSWSITYITCTRSSHRLAQSRVRMPPPSRGLHVLSLWPGWEQVSQEWGCFLERTRAWALKSAMLMLWLQSCPTLYDPTDRSPPGTAVPGILQARILEWVAISLSNAWKRKVKANSLHHVWLLAPHGLQPTRLLRPWIFQARVLEWGAIAFSTKTSWPSAKSSLGTHCPATMGIWFLSLYFSFFICETE